MSNMQAPENDPIDEILSEVEQLRRELSGEAAAAMAATETPSESSETSSEFESESVSESDSQDTPSDDELMQEFRASTVGEGVDDGDGMESTLVELPREELDSSVKALLEQTVAEVEASHHEDVQTRMPSSMEKGSKSMSSSNSEAPAVAAGGGGVANLGIVLSGDLNLRLQSENGGPDVVIRFVDQCLIVQLPDGIEMKFPLGGRGGNSGRGGIKRVA